jgi:hypothetical protein
MTILVHNMHFGRGEGTCMIGQNNLDGGRIH